MTRDARAITPAGPTRPFTGEEFLAARRNPERRRA
jgi:hypothetical protein